MIDYSRRFECWCGRRHYYGTKVGDSHMRKASAAPRFPGSDETEHQRLLRELAEDDS